MASRINNQPRLSHHTEPRTEKFNPVYLIPIFGQILFLIRLVGKALTTPKNLKEHTVTEQTTTPPTAKRVSRAAQQVRTTKTRKTTTSKNDTTPSFSPVRSRSPSPEARLTASRVAQEKETLEREESASSIIPILKLASIIENAGFHTKDEVAVLNNLLKKQAHYEEKYGLTELVTPLTRLANAIAKSTLQ